jgi:hypothetical protein
VQLVGHRVRATRERLRRECLPAGSECLFSRVIVDGKLVGHACAVVWSVEKSSVCWVTQLVVHREYRERGLATGLLSEFGRDYHVYGIASSHPAALLACGKAFGSKWFGRQMDVDDSQYHG